jgi:hypothetical protein
VWGFTGTIFFPSAVFAIFIAFNHLCQIGKGITYRENQKTLTFGFSHPCIKVKAGELVFPTEALPFFCFET